MPKQQQQQQSANFSETIQNPLENEEGWMDNKTCIAGSPHVAVHAVIVPPLSTAKLHSHNHNDTFSHQIGTQFFVVNAMQMRP
jgi:hypothetical protein